MSFEVPGFSYKFVFDTLLPSLDFRACVIAIVAIKGVIALPDSCILQVNTRIVSPNPVHFKNFYILSILPLSISLS